MDPIEQDELNAARAEEQKALSDSQSKYFLERVILLRAQLNRTTQELNEANEKIRAFENEGAVQDPSD